MIVSMSAVLLPIFALAAGLVPCEGVTGQVGGSTSLGCNVCHLAELVNNAVNWLVNFAFAIATLFVIYGGYLYMTSGWWPKQLDEAKSVLTGAVYGLIIVLLSWVAINSALKYLTGSDSWYHIQCNIQAAAQININQPGVTLAPATNADLKSAISALEKEKSQLTGGLQPLKALVEAAEALQKENEQLIQQNASLFFPGDPRIEINKKKIQENNLKMLDLVEQAKKIQNTY